MAQILDAYALVALTAEEAAAPAVEDMMRSGSAAITSINLAEAVDVSCRVHGIAFSSVTAVLEPLVLGGHLRLIAPGAKESWRAAQLRVVYYRRRERPLSLADCFLLASAGPGDQVATADPAVAEVARAEGIELIGLPDSSGRRP